MNEIVHLNPIPPRLLVRTERPTPRASASNDAAAEPQVAQFAPPAPSLSVLVASMREIGMSTRAIASATGTPRRTVRRAMSEVGHSGPPGPVTGTDGKIYTPTPAQPLLSRFGGKNECIALYTGGSTFLDRSFASALPHPLIDRGARHLRSSSDLTDRHRGFAVYSLKH